MVRSKGLRWGLANPPELLFACPRANARVTFNPEHGDLNDAGRLRAREPTA